MWFFRQLSLRTAINVTAAQASWLGTWQFYTLPSLKLTKRWGASITMIGLKLSWLLWSITIRIMKIHR